MKSVIRTNLKASLLDGVFFSLMVGLGESYFSAFILALGLSQVTSGLVSTLPFFVGSLIQLISPYGVHFFRSHKRWVILSATLQGCSFAPLIWIALSGTPSVLFIFLLVSLYWGAGMGAGPAWNAWMSSLVPSAVRIRFFAKRTRYVQSAGLLALLAGGFLLDLYTSDRSHRPPQAFISLFLLAGFFRIVSAWMISRQSEGPQDEDLHRLVPMRETFRKLTRGPYGKVVSYLFFLHVGVYFSAPFVTPYLLGELKFSYIPYTILIAASYVAKIFVLPYAGELGNRKGVQTILKIGALGIIPLPAFWLISDRFPFVLSLQILSGILWAVHELAIFLTLYDQIPEEERTSVLSVINFINISGMMIGSLAGGILLKYFSQGHTGYMWVFGISSLLRIVPALFLPQMLQAMNARGKRSSKKKRGTSGFRGVRPTVGAMDKPLLASSRSGLAAKSGDPSKS